MLIHCHILIVLNIDSIVIKVISCTKVAQVESSLTNSSTEWDELPTFVAKECVNEYIEPLT